MNDDPTEDIYRILDEAGMAGATFFNSKKAMSKIVNEVRTDLAARLRSYIVRYGQQQYHLGVLKGKDKDEPRSN